jgi:hypothetical protein
MPAACEIGAQARYRISAGRSHPARTLCTSCAIARSGSMAAFGTPVVPPV